MSSNSCAAQVMPLRKESVGLRSDRFEDEYELEDELGRSVYVQMLSCEITRQLRYLRRPFSTHAGHDSGDSWFLFASSR